MSELIMHIPWLNTNEFIARKGVRTGSHGIWSPQGMCYKDLMHYNSKVQAPSKHLSMWSQYSTFGKEVDHTMNKS